MSGQEFFINRYRQLGWQFKPVHVRQAIRINQSNAKGKNLPERLGGLGVELEKIPFLEMGYWVGRSKVSAGATAEYLLGLYSIQEAAAQIPVTLFTNLKNKSALDACAAPGGKTTQLADLMDNRGSIVALDVESKRLAALANHLERCHVRCTVVYTLDARRTSGLNLKFDRILLDVPCSGNFASDPDWLSRRTLRDVERNSMVQREILFETVKCLSENGEIVYSTCSLEPEEDELNVDWAIKNLGLQVQHVNCHGAPGLTNVFGRQLDTSIAMCKRIWPDETQGFFVCKLKRRPEQP
ncbi:MAG TPA: RsmB/NOP family class I SAM-dependent RNA methyltransferase [Candidatus Nanoarchaeia archaeon]|nr:RsmB/NOP family class I SAM-dependent RNA methyltransferase [Candidatus Nanoarchaeia archaeon]